MSSINLITFHRKLLNAPERMDIYQQAIHATVRPGDVVIDLGCGSGILGMFACQAGASKVFAIERSDAITLAKKLAHANGFADRIIYLNKTITEVTLERKADVIVSELISKGVLGQRMAESVGWCRDNLLKPGGKILPSEVELLVAPIENADIYRKVEVPDTQKYNLDFSCIAKHSVNIPLSARIPYSSLLSPGKVGYHYLAASASTTEHVDCTLSFEITRNGLLHGFALWFSSLLCNGITLANTPPGIAAWDNLFLPLEHPVTVTKGMTVELKLKGRDDSKMPMLWSWETIIKNETKCISSQKQSTFYAQLVR